MDESRVIFNRLFHSNTDKGLIESFTKDRDLTHLGKLRPVIVPDRMKGVPQGSSLEILVGVKFRLFSSARALRGSRVDSPPPRDPPP